MPRSLPRSVLALAPIGLALAVVLPAAPASACGGFFCNQPQNPWDPPPAAQTAENVAFAVDSSTGVDMLEAHVQVFYAGPADKFSWVVPVLSEPTLDVGTNALFNALLAVTTPRFGVQWHQEGMCKVPPGGGYGEDGRGGAADAGAGGSGGQGGAKGGGVDVSFQGAVGPYDAAVIKSDDAQALETWLSDNGYFVSPEASAIIDQYVNEHHWFVALKLLPEKGVAEIAPIVLRFRGTEPCVPLRLTAVAALANLRVNLWVLADKRAIPTNYYELTVNQARLDWLRGGDNYAQLLQEAADEAGGNAFAAEFAGSARALDGTLARPGQFDTLPQTLRASTTPPEFMGTLQFSGLPRDNVLLGILRKHIPEPQVLIDMGIDERTFYNLLSSFWAQYSEAFAPFDADAATTDIESAMIEPLQKAQALVDRFSYLTRLTTFISPDEMTRDPMFSFNNTLGDVPAVRMADAYMMCGYYQYGTCNAPVRVETPDGHKILMRPSTKVEDKYCYGPAPTYDRGRLDKLPALDRAWSREEKGPGALVFDNTQRTNEELARHNGSVSPFLPAAGDDGCAVGTVSLSASAWGAMVLGALALIVRRRRSR